MKTVKLKLLILFMIIPVSKADHMGVYSFSNSQPIRITPIAQYSCQYYADTWVNAPYSLSTFSKVHFYHTPSVVPEPIRPSFNNYVCHDITSYGWLDNVLFPRLELKPLAMALWNDKRAFSDQNNNGKYDIDDYIEMRFLFEYGENINVNLFSPLKAKSSPMLGAKSMGYMMGFFNDPFSSLSYCLTEDHYNGENPLHRLIGEVVQLDTEAIYLAEKEFELITDKRGDTLLAEKDYLFITESILKKVWFYHENGIHYSPTEYTASTKAIHFYYPFDFDHPYIKKSYQRLYSLKRVNTSSSDKRIGCVPKLL